MDSVINFDFRNVRVFVNAGMQLPYVKFSKYIILNNGGNES